MSIAPYPHVEIAVRDESIYTPIETENLPLNKPLYMMKCAKGPVGVPVWCSQYVYAARIFGEDTFNKRSEYFSEQAYFLLKTFPMNGAFIMRVCDSTAKTAVISIELGVAENQDVPQWKRDANGRFVLNMDLAKIPINANGEDCKPVEGETPTKVYIRALEAVAIQDHMPYFTRKSNYVYTGVTPSTRRFADLSYFVGSGVPQFELAGSTFDSSALYFEFNDVSEGADTVTPAFGITSFEAGKTYLKFAGFAGGYKTASVEDLPEIVPGQKIGDMFSNISTDAFEVVAEGNKFVGVRDQSLEKQPYETYFFTRDLDAETPYEYTEVQLPVGTPLGDGMYFYESGEISPGVLEPQATLKGIKLAWRAHVRSDYTARPVGTVESIDSDNFTWYPMIDIVAANRGCWGNKFGIRLFYDQTANTVSGIAGNSAVTYSIAPMQLVGDDTTPTDILDKFGLAVTNGVMLKGAVDPSTGVDLCVDKRLANAYSEAYELPMAATYIYENWDKVGKLVMAAEIEGNMRSQISTLYKNFRTIVDAEGNLVAETFVDALVERLATADDVAAENAGYQCNVVSAVDGENIPYFCTEVVNADDALVTSDTLIDAGSIVVPSSKTVIYLAGGEDGDLSDAATERNIRAQITLALNSQHEYLNDYARCPFNAIYDTGVSMDTKKAYCDLLTVRDSLVVNLATQSTWKNADGSDPAVAGYYPNARMDDESIGSFLRSYAWLMREDVANGTECCRCKIFLHAGYTSDHDGPVASTLWIAMKNAQYLNRNYIYMEAKGLPNADVSCWTKLSWVAYAEDTKSRCWNAGLNYVQYYDMTHIHYASVRSVYRYETSILVDAGVVDALCFMKDEVRRSWAKFAGVTIPANELNALITDDLQGRFDYLLNHKYNHAENVYQTDEDMKLGYVRHVDIQLISPATNRVWLATIICRRENYNPEA